jgi:hypothetical protein
MRHGQRNTLIAVCVAAFLGMVILVVLAAYPQDAPTVDGLLYANEYTEYGNNPAWVMDGNYSTLYTKYITEGDPNTGLYVCNDWWNAEEAYNPIEDCAGMNQYDWTDTDPYPNVFWRIKVYGNKDGNQAIEVWRRVNQQGTSWQPQDCNGWYHAVGYAKSPEHQEEEHPIWELRIPASDISKSIIIGLVDPKFVDPDPNQCPPVEDPNTDAREEPSYGEAPEFTQGGPPPPPPCP